MVHFGNMKIKTIKTMRWIKVSEIFPDDWESKILRTVTIRIVLINDEWRHVNDHFWHSEKRINFDYAEIEWLDELEPDQDILWEEVVTLSLGKEKEEALPNLKKLYTLIRK